MLIPLIGVFAYIVAARAASRRHRPTAAMTTAGSQPSARAPADRGCRTDQAGRALCRASPSGRVRGRAATRQVAALGARSVGAAGGPTVGPVELLEDQARRRVPELVPIRYGRMLASPFAFYRGAAAVMAADLADDAADRPARRSSAATPTCRTSGSFAAPDRRLVFSINDFDETLPGPFEWDVKRLVGSFAVAGRTAA